MDNGEMITVEVAFSKPDQQVLLNIEVVKGTTLREAIQRSGIMESFPEIDLDQNTVGIFGKVRDLEEVLDAGDRVEIYRPLIADPKEIRKQRAAQGKTMKKGVK
jgi:putative ubiquitin-RnfH superfamily antitoxin RatB of RatAB toxin-antitoxin module